jgi:hypothetical protein
MDTLRKNEISVFKILKPNAKAKKFYVTYRYTSMQPLELKYLSYFSDNLSVLMKFSRTFIIFHKKLLNKAVFMLSLFPLNFL